MKLAYLWGRFKGLWSRAPRAEEVAVMVARPTWDAVIQAAKEDGVSPDDEVLVASHLHITASPELRRQVIRSLRLRGF